MEVGDRLTVPYDSPFARHDPTGDRPLFSMIVPFLNEERRLPKCLVALRPQTIDPGLVEWILIDSGSTDRSAATVLVEAMPVVGDTEIIHRLRRRHPIAVVRRCCRMHGYGLGRWLALWGILALDYGAFLTGRLARRFTRWRA